MVKLCLKLKTPDGDTVVHHIHYFGDGSPLQVRVTRKKKISSGRQSPKTVAKEGDQSQPEDNSLDLHSKRENGAQSRRKNLSLSSSLDSDSNEELDSQSQSDENSLDSDST